MSHTLSNSVLPAPRATGAGGGKSALHWLDYTFLILAPSRAGQYSRWMLFNLKQFELYWTVLHRKNLAKKKNAAKVGVDYYLIGAKKKTHVERSQIK